MKKLISLLFFLCLSSSAFSNVRIEGRQVYILYSGLDSVWGSYLFMVSNSDAKPASAKFKVMLPEETEDFEAQQGLIPMDIKLGEDGGLYVDKVFPSGDTLITIGFKVPSYSGVADITVKPVMNIPAFSYFVAKDSLKVEGQDLEFLSDQYFSGKNYDTYTAVALSSGKSYSVQVLGSPEGRYNYWLIGAVVGVILLLLLAYAYFIRPEFK